MIDPAAYDPREIVREVRWMVAGASQYHRFIVREYKKDCTELTVEYTHPQPHGFRRPVWSADIADVMIDYKVSQQRMVVRGNLLAFVAAWHRNQPADPHVTDIYSSLGGKAEDLLRPLRSDQALVEAQKRWRCPVEVHAHG